MILFPFFVFKNRFRHFCFYTKKSSKTIAAENPRDRRLFGMEKSLALVAQHAAFKEGIMKVWQPKGVGNDPPSLTIKEVNIHLIGSKEVLVLPVYTNTKVFEIKALLIERLSANPDHLRLVQKQGSSFRVQQDHEEVARTVTLHGIKSFKRVEAADKTGDAKSFCHDDGVISRNFQQRVFHLRPAWGTQSVGQNPCGFPIPTSVGQFSDTFWGYSAKNWTQTHNFSVFLTKSTRNSNNRNFGVSFFQQLETCIHGSLKARYELPHVIIGAGHIGLKLAMTWIMDGYSHWVFVDGRGNFFGSQMEWIGCNSHQQFFI